MGYFVGKMISEREGLIESVPALRELWKTKREFIELKWNIANNTIWFKFGKNVLMRIDRSAVLKILRFHEMDHVEGGGVFFCAKSLKEIHDEIVYDDPAYTEGSEEFYFVSLLQYYYDVSPSTICRLGKKGKYMRFKRRSCVKRGRKVGVDYTWGAPRELSEEEKAEMKERIAWNKKVGITKGIYFVYEDAFREECRLENKHFDKEVCVKKFDEERRKGL